MLDNGKGFSLTLEHHFFNLGLMRRMGKKQAGVFRIRAMFIAFALIVGSTPLVHSSELGAETVVITLYPGSGRSGHAVVLAFPGAFYPQPHRLSFDLSIDPEAAYATPERLVQTVLAANRARDVEAAAKAYAPELRDRFRMSEAKRLEKQGGSMNEREAPAVDLLGWIRFGSYVSLVQRAETIQGKRVTGLTPPMQFREGQWMICSELHDARWKLLQDVIRNGFLPEPMATNTPTALSSRVPLSASVLDTDSSAAEFTILHMGRNFAPAVRVTRQPPSTEGDDVFLSALELVFSQYATGDPDKILGIVLPNERSELTDFIRRSARSIGSTVAEITDVSVKAQVLYGQYVLALLSYSTARGVQEDWLAFARDGNGWFVTDMLRDDSLVVFLGGKRFGFPKIAPIIWEQKELAGEQE